MGVTPLPGPLHGAQRVVNFHVEQQGHHSRVHDAPPALDVVRQELHRLHRRLALGVVRQDLAHRVKAGPACFPVAGAHPRHDRGQQVFPKVEVRQGAQEGTHARQGCGAPLRCPPPALPPARKALGALHLRQEELEEALVTLQQGLLVLSQLGHLLRDLHRELLVCGRADPVSRHNVLEHGH